MPARVHVRSRSHANSLSCRHTHERLWRGLLAVLCALIVLSHIGCKRKSAPTAHKAAHRAALPSAPTSRNDDHRARRSRRSYRAEMAPKPTASAVAPGGGSAGPMLASPRPDKAKPKGKASKDNKKKAQVWQRSKDNTVLSKVSVGGKNYLILKKMRVTVSVEGLRARTVIDHIYYNPHHRQLQGTFKYTLPAQASVSYYAMFIGRRRRSAPRFFGRKMGRQLRRRLPGMAPQLMVKQVSKPDWGKLREARLVAAEKGREVYEEITRQRIDPALLEQDAPNTFTGRVFPIPPRGYNRVIIAYEQTLPQLRDELVYRFRFPNDVAQSIDFSIEYNDKLAKVTRTNLRKIRCKADPQASFMRCYWEQNKPDRDAVFYFKPQHKHVNWVAGTDPVENHNYLYARARVQLPKGPGQFGSSQGLFALDTSLSANPDLFAAHVALLQQILVRNEKRMPRFNVLLFDVDARWYKSDGWVDNTPEARARLATYLKGVVLEGATNFDAALQKLARPSWSIKAGMPVDIFVLSDGQLNWGDTQIESSIASFHKHKAFGTTRFFTYQLGVGAENAIFQQRLAREGGAQFSCLGRAELPRCAVAHTRPAMLLETAQIEGIGASELLVEGRQVSLYPGALVAVAARFSRNGKANLVLKGRYLGKPIIIRHSFNVQADGDLAPRAWAELVTTQLSELEDDRLTKLIVAYSQHFRIPNKHCSFLVLETNKEYKQYGLDKLKKTQRVSDVALFLEAWIKRFGVDQSPRKRWLSIIDKGVKRAHMSQTSAGRFVRGLLRKLPDSTFVFASAGAEKRWSRERVPSEYLTSRLRDQQVFDPFVDEAKRRLKEDPGGAIRALSCIVELHPSNPQALRLVAYYLMAWERHAEAAQIFLRVLERRSFEPHSYRDLARALVKMERFGLAAVLYEIATAGRWHRRFRSIHTVLREEYAMLMYQAKRSKGPTPQVRRTLSQRRSLLGLKVKRSKLRVTVTWNTDNTDVDLWVTGPGGEKCDFRNRSTRNGGRLLQDITRGYGPERYQNIGGRSGRYHVQLEFYGHRTNVLGNETHVSVNIVLHAGTSRQKIIEKNFVLKRRKQIVDVARLSL